MPRSASRSGTSRATLATNQTLAIAYLAYAWKVIENYCFNRGAQNRGGTGLPTSQVAAVYQQQPAATEQPPDQNIPGFLIDERQSVAVPMEDRQEPASRSRIPMVDHDRGAPAAV